MNAAPLYTYRLSGRRAGTVFALAVCVLMAVFGFSYGAPWYFLAPAALAGAMALFAIIANPQTGSELSADTLSLFNRGTAETVRIADIASMTVRRWSDGPDTVALTLKTGRVVHVPSLCADSKLAVALRQLGIVEVNAR